MRYSLAVAAIVLLLAAPGGVGAKPVASPVHQVGDLRIIGDSDRDDRFYLLPGSMQLVTADDGGPDLKLFITRYVGSSVFGDSGDFEIESLLRFRVQLVQRVETHRDVLVDWLRTELGVRRPTVVALPISRIDSRVVYTPLDTEESSDDASEALSVDGFLDPIGHSPRRKFWQEREFVVSLDDHTAQLFWNQWRDDGALLLSLDYAFWADLVMEEGGEIASEGEVPEELQDILDEQDEGIAGDGETERLTMVYADVLPVRVDGVAFPDRFERLDLNDSLPPTYPFLKVYCYDFRDQVDPELFEKSVEFVAQGVTGGETMKTVVFSIDDVDVRIQTVRFPFAVDLSQPYQYRVRQVYLSGEIAESEWETRDSWASIVDISQVTEE